MLPSCFPYSGMDELGLTAYAAGLLGEYLSQQWQDRLAAVSCVGPCATATWRAVRRLPACFERIARVFGSRSPGASQVRLLSACWHYSRCRR